MPLAWLMLSLPSFGDDQTSSQLNAGQTNGQGSDNSLRESYGNALTAVNSFFQMNIPGAVSSGLKAYGQYRNSNQLDQLHGQNNQLAASMASVGGGAAAEVASDGGASGGQDQSSVTGSDPSAASSPYSRLDTGFLYQGSTGEVAGQIEKMSGMPREQMFQMMAGVQAASPDVSDPNFIPWAMKTYHDLSARMPNAEFRGKLDSLGGYLDQTVKSGLAQSILAKFQAVDGPKPASVTAKAGEENGTQPNASDETAASAGGPAAVKEESASAGLNLRRTVAAGADPAKAGMERVGFDPVDGYLGEMIRAQNQEGANRSIFEAVSDKLRELTLRQHLGRKNL